MAIAAEAVHKALKSVRKAAVDVGTRVGSAFTTIPGSSEPGPAKTTNASRKRRGSAPPVELPADTLRMGDFRRRSSSSSASLMSSKSETQFGGHLGSPPGRGNPDRRKRGRIFRDPREGINAIKKRPALSQLSFANPAYDPHARTYGPPNKRASLERSRSARSQLGFPRTGRRPSLGELAGDTEMETLYDPTKTLTPTSSTPRVDDERALPGERMSSFKEDTDWATRFGFGRANRPAPKVPKRESSILNKVRQGPKIISSQIHMPSPIRGRRVPAASTAPLHMGEEALEMHSLGGSTPRRGSVGSSTDLKRRLSSAAHSITSSNESALIRQASFGGPVPPLTNFRSRIDSIGSIGSIGSLRTRFGLGSGSDRESWSLHLSDLGRSRSHSLSQLSGDQPTPAPLSSTRRGSHPSVTPRNRIPASAFPPMTVIEPGEETNSIRSSSSNRRGGRQRKLKIKNPLTQVSRAFGRITGRTGSYDLNPEGNDRGKRKTRKGLKKFAMLTGSATTGGLLASIPTLAVMASKPGTNVSQTVNVGSGGSGGYSNTPSVYT
jgi:hypothetical protein